MRPVKKMNSVERNISIFLLCVVMFSFGVLASKILLKPTVVRYGSIDELLDMLAEGQILTIDDYNARYMFIKTDEVGFVLLAKETKEVDDYDTYSGD